MADGVTMHFTPSETVTSKEGLGNDEFMKVLRKVRKLGKARQSVHENQESK